VLQQALSGAVEIERKLKLMHWIAEMVRSQHEQKGGKFDDTDLATEIEQKQLHVLGPILLGKSVLKAWGSIGSRVKFCNDAKSFEPWLSSCEKAVQALHSVIRKEMEGEVEPINTKWQLVRPHVLFVDNISSRVNAYAELIKAKCAKLQLTVPEQSYFDLISEGAITGKIDTK